MGEKPMDQAKAEVFANTAFVDVAAAFTVTMCAIRDCLGLFKNLDSDGPATSSELAKRAGINERYSLEWLSALTCAGYLDYNPDSQRFALPREHAPVLAHEGGPLFMGGTHQQMPPTLKPVDQVIQAFRNGGGISQSVYGHDYWVGFERLTNSWFENLLTQRWIPAMPGLQQKLRQGATVADVGCGNDRALIKMAKIYPESRYVGYDNHPPSIEYAVRNAQEAGVTNKVRFVELDVTDGFPEQYGLITTFDVIHDMVIPRRALKAI
ncbi:MAG: class I SAM-dependent methyltransferase [SAR202 cluster bacterium]|jgi:hypothetical protein|nr:class I SAM-dependent methyltransferase [SAR202 cluster bacterium]